jgi:hypothetical protein
MSLVQRCLSQAGHWLKFREGSFVWDLAIYCTCMRKINFKSGRVGD